MTDATTQAAAPAHPLPALLQALLAVAADDGLKAILPVIRNALTALQGNGSLSNITAQGLMIATQAPLVLPTLENTVTEAMAGIANTAIANAAAQAETSLAQAQAPLPTPATPAAGS